MPLHSWLCPVCVSSVWSLLLWYLVTLVIARFFDQWRSWLPWSPWAGLSWAALGRLGSHVVRMATMWSLAKARTWRIPWKTPETRMQHRCACPWDARGTGQRLERGVAWARLGDSPWGCTSARGWSEGGALWGATRGERRGRSPRWDRALRAAISATPVRVSRRRRLARCSCQLPLRRGGRLAPAVASCQTGERSGGVAADRVTWEDGVRAQWRSGVPAVGCVGFPGLRGRRTRGRARDVGVSVAAVAAAG